MRVLMIGCGKMGGALLSRWASDDAHSFTVIVPNSELSEPGVRVERSPGAIAGERFDMLVIAIKPQMIADVMPAYTGHLAEGGVVVSMAAGTSCASLEKVLGEQAIVRIMPNMPSAIGKGVSGAWANARTRAEQRAAIEAMMLRAGELVWVEEEDGLDRVTAIAGSGPGYVFEIARTYVEAARELGFSEDQARRLVLATMAGTVEMAARSDQSLADLRNAVTSKAGTTEAGLNALNGGGDLSTLLQATTRAAYARAVELR